MDIAYYSNTRISAKDIHNESYVGVDNLLQNKKGKTTSSHVPNSGFLIKYQMEDILIGNIRPYLKKIWRASNNGGTNGDVLTIRINEDKKNQISSEYLYYVLSSDSFFDYSMNHAKGAKMPRGDKNAIMKYEIPIPEINKQKNIASILRKFDLLVNDISIGLPAELSARRTQYEYYRNKLLTFSPLGV